MKQFIQKYQEILIICLISLIVRLIIMPFAQSNDADATSRVFIARELMDNFRLIMSGHWAPIHHYFNALSLFIINDNVYGPKVLNILFAVASCVPVYFFTKNEFNKQGAFFVALIYSFSPVVFKNSFLAMAEVSYAFFVLLSMYFLSNGIRSKDKIKYAIYAGISITIAGGIRYEAWELMALFFIVLVLFKQWKMILPFILFSLIFPVYWMIGNQIEQKDFLYSFHYARYWADMFSGYNVDITKAEQIKRIAFFPTSWFFMLTPFISLILVFMLFKKVLTKKINKALLIWLIPFIVIMLTYIYSAYKGTLFTQHRFTITLVLLSVPFFALFFENENNLKVKKIIVFILIVLMVPLSFRWSKIIPIRKINTYSYPMFWALENSLNIEKNDAIPLIRDEETEALLSSIKFQLSPKKGIILDFIGWDKTYYIALNSKASYKDIFMVDGTTLEVYRDLLTSFLKDHQDGLIAIKAFSTLDKICHSQGALLEIQNVPYGLYLEKCLDFNDIKLFRYSVRQKDWIERYKIENQHVDGITKTIKNTTYWENSIRNNENWLEEVDIKAKKKSISLDEMIKLDAQWMVDQDLLNTKKDSI